MEFGGSPFRLQVRIRVRLSRHLSLLLQRSRRLLQHAGHDYRRCLLAQSNPFTFAIPVALSFSLTVSFCFTFTLAIGFSIAFAKRVTFPKSKREPVTDANPSGWLGRSAR